MINSSALKSNKNNFQMASDSKPDIQFDILLDALIPLLGDLEDKSMLNEEFVYVIGHPLINQSLNKVEEYLHNESNSINDLAYTYQILKEYFDNIRQVYYDGLYANCWSPAQIKRFETINMEIYSNIMETFGGLE